jgi:hypothetical protein
MPLNSWGQAWAETNQQFSRKFKPDFTPLVLLPDIHFQQFSCYNLKIYLPWVEFLNTCSNRIHKDYMKEKTDKSRIKDEARALRKKNKRVEESRSLIKAKSREKGKTIKAYQDRQTELEQNRDEWNAKSKEQERERIEADKYKHVAALFDIKEEQLKEILKEFEDLKKKYPPKNRQ